ncbi:Ribosomal RNA small subunit methyltransferase C [Ignavibacterium album JCM 16511]|uniref:Ribosomal RNA small subunit methyltransferase C n=1 Tax=Ignavibacterium album (strain DSM 19864 / JCM 16511 / NBRC 101810 / Mat9-16) TaxID=945713 RepID=I0ANA7_IGNAJ|nr:methyltransferase [Ignavibacterium album]AFH50464.1 Ribosomal RNA small subunit methyltransferase C [Ignavibacterium album JCM 16511]
MKIFKRILFVVLSRVYKIYSTKIRNYNFREIKLKILPGVFHPGFFFSTKFLISYLDSYELKDKRVLELGAGSGMISVYCAMKGASVSASDISLSAIDNIKINSSLNDCSIDVVYSDLFDSISKQEFDFIIINPPYFPQNPKNEAEFAWFCGSEFQYFEKLFKQITDFLYPQTIALMVLSEDCDIKKIKAIANKNNVEMKLIESKKFFGEENFIYQLRLNKN